MSSQRKISSVSFSKNIAEGKRILDLEKKYQEILLETFSLLMFRDGLETIEDEIKTDYSFLHNKYKIKNKIKIPAEPCY